MVVVIERMMSQTRLQLRGKTGSTLVMKHRPPRHVETFTSLLPNFIDSFITSIRHQIREQRVQRVSRKRKTRDALRTAIMTENLTPEEMP